jgi:hypothetical protein
LRSSRCRPTIAPVIDGHDAAAVAPCQLEPALCQRLFEGRAVVRGLPGLPEDSLDLARVETHPPCLLPFFAREGERIAQERILEPARHVPAMLKEELAGDIPQLHLVVRQVDRPHLCGIDPRPNDVSMPPPVLLMEDHGTRLIGQAELFLGSGNRLFEGLDWHIGFVGRVEAQGEEMVAAPRPAGDGIGLAEGFEQVRADKPSHFKQLDMIVLAHGEEVAPELGGIAAFLPFEDHGPSSGILPRARRRSARRAAISRQADFRSASVSGVTGREPVFTALASWLRFEDSRDWPSAPSTRARAALSLTGLLPFRLRCAAPSPSSCLRMNAPSGMSPASASSR